MFSVHLKQKYTVTAKGTTKIILADKVPLVLGDNEKSHTDYHHQYPTIITIIIINNIAQLSHIIIQIIFTVSLRQI